MIVAKQTCSQLYYGFQNILFGDDNIMISHDESCHNGIMLFTTSSMWNSDCVLSKQQLILLLTWIYSVSTLYFFLPWVLRSPPPCVCLVAQDCSISQNSSRLHKIAQDCSRLPKIAQDCSRLHKIAQNCSRLHKIPQNCSRLLKIAQDCSKFVKIA